MDWMTLGRIGLILNFAGTVLVALSFGRNLGAAYQTDDRGRRIYLASFLYPNLFRLGLGLAAVGFLLQLFG
jgi:hypothetical protein